MFSFALLLIMQAGAVVAIAPDSAEALREQARRAERDYEWVARRYAPLTRSWPVGGECDERVGRFCLRFARPTAQRRELPPEPPPALAARRSAVEALRRAFAADPGRLEVAGALVRYLVEDERAVEAAAAARTFAWATDEVFWGPLLLGFALHYAGEVEAEHHFQKALDAMPPSLRSELTAPDWLLEHGERRLYRRLDAEEQARYEEEFWRAAEPLYLVPGNERWREHLARWVWSRLLESAPRVAGAHRWGSDLDQLTARYGPPKRRERARYTGMVHIPLSQQMVERYDPDQLDLTPAALRTEGIPAAPLPGDSADLERRRAQSRHTPVTVRRLVGLEHQVSRFPAGSNVALRVDGMLPLDSISRKPDNGRGPPSVDGALFLRGEAHGPVSERRHRALVRADTAWLGLELTAQPGRYHYSLEALETDTRLAGRARHPVELEPWPDRGPRLSDLLLALPYGAAALPDSREHASLRPRAHLVLEPEEVIGVYAEVHALEAGAGATSRYAVELSVHPADAEPLPARAVRWLGRALGIASEPARPKIAWEAESAAGETAIIALDVDLAGLDPGLYALRLAVRDLVSREEARTERLVRVGGP